MATEALTKQFRELINDCAYFFEIDLRFGLQVVKK